MSRWRAANGPGAMPAQTTPNHPPTHPPVHFRKQVAIHGARLARGLEAPLQPTPPPSQLPTLPTAKPHLPAHLDLGLAGLQPLLHRNVLHAQQRALQVQQLLPPRLRELDRLRGKRWRWEVGGGRW